MDESRLDVSSSSTPVSPDEEPTTGDRCLNCQTRLRGKYCHVCGQAARVRRLRVGRLLKDAMENLWDVDSRLLRTARDLTVQPGTMIRAYVDGARTPYASPLRYYVLVLTFNIGLAGLLGITDVATAGMNDGRGIDYLASLQIGLLYAVTALPVTAIQGVLRRGDGHFFIEHYVLLLYTLAQSSLTITLLDALLTLGTETELDGLSEAYAWLGVFALMTIEAGRTFYQESVWETTWRLAVALGGSLVGIGLSFALMIKAYGWMFG